MKKALAIIALSTLLLGCGMVSSFYSLTLKWDAPTTNRDGTPLTDLAGYKVCYGKRTRDYKFCIDVGNVTTATVEGLVMGDPWYFAIVAYDTSGNESDPSEEVSG